MENRAMVNIRAERRADYDDIENVVRLAFEGLDYSDQTEHQLVRRLRQESNYLPPLSLIASINGNVVGHVMCTSLGLEDAGPNPGLIALAPLSVLPDWQGQGIGSQLMHAVHEKARELNYKGILLVGDPTYYKRFGYEPSSNYGLSVPFQIDPHYVMVKALYVNALSQISGKAIYAQPFMREP